MNTAVLDTITAELTAAGWHAIAPQESDPRAPIVQALQRHRVKADDRVVRAVSAALEARRPKPERESVDDLGLPMPTRQELAEEAAWLVDVFWAYSFTRQDGAWVFENPNVVADAAPENLRRTCFRAGLFVAQAHGLPQSKAPNMRDVVRALQRRLWADGRVKRG
ncbi:hypothetical protein [Streptomyces thermoalcalitolerans]|uniref:Uncharacterized protein n=1 Tax=Streptomyces thermoalcalitolerans TaxID=65605 RepID=A0ABN1NRR5_9ACTN